MSSMLHSIAPEFDNLVTVYGFKVIESTVKPEEFGNASVILESTGIRLRIYTDRGQRFVDVARYDQNWHKLEYVLEFIQPSFSQANFGEPPNLGKLFDVFIENIDLVRNLFSSDLETCGFFAFEEEKAAILLAKLFPAKKI